MGKILFIAVIFISIISCTPDQEKKVDEVATSNLQEKATISSIGITLSPKAKKEVAGWEKYQLIETKMQRYQSVTKSEAIQNARDLSLLIEDASDTIDVKLLDRPDVKIRFNVLYNHAYRLHDMLSITSISEEEVMTEVTRLLDAYSSLNDKINVVFKMDEYKDSFGITELDTAIFNAEEPMFDNVETHPKKQSIGPVKSSQKVKQNPKEKSSRIESVNKDSGQKKQKLPFRKTNQLKKE